MSVAAEALEEFRIETANVSRAFADAVLGVRRASMCRDLAEEASRRLRSGYVKFKNNQEAKHDVNGRAVIVKGDDLVRAASILLTHLEALVASGERS